MSVRHIALFAKVPRAGHVKTRLAPLLGEAGAAKLAEACLLDLVERLIEPLPSGPVRVSIFYAPSEAEPELRSMLGPMADFVSLHLQINAELGSRMAQALDTLQRSAPGPVVFLGADAPDLPIESVTAAFDHTERGMAFLQHASDGGYVLLGLPSGAPAVVFDGVPWSTRETARRQLERVRANGVTIAESAMPWWDVDTPADVGALVERLRGGGPRLPRVREFLASVQFSWANFTA